MSINKLYIKGSAIFGDKFESNLLFENIADKSEKPILSTELKNSVDSCAIGTKEFKEDIVEIYKLKVPSQFPPSIKYRKMYGNLLDDDTNTSLPWNLCLPNDVFKKELTTYIHSIKAELESVESLQYYFDVYQKHNIVFESLQPAKIHRQSFLKALLSPETPNRDILNGFTPDESRNDYIKAPIKYLRNSTTTGRLKVAEGSPNILTISKELRNQILSESRFGSNGKIYYLDFKSLEPRVLLSILSSPLYVTKVPLLLSPTCDDIYNEVIDKLGIVGVTRKTAKLAILMAMYGAGKEAIIEKLREQEKIEDKKIAEKISSFVLEAFQIDFIKDNLCVPNKHKIMYNFYGRPILVDGVDEYKFLNYFIQSTAVEVALFGFANIIKKLIQTNTMDKIVPIFVLHDALLIDAHNDYEHVLSKLASFGGKNIQGLEHIEFPIEVSKLSDNI